MSAESWTRIGLPSWAALAMCFALVSGGCGEAPPADSGGISLPDAGGLPEVISFADTGAPLDVAAGDTSAGSDDAGGESCEFPANPLAGEPGSSCEQPSDCDSGYCVDAPGGKVCSRTCVECCPKGFACETAPSSDVVLICVPKLKALCTPCNADSECGALAAGALCVGYGAGGAFCGGGCVADDDCPKGYACKESTGSQGSAKQCVRTEGECPCSEAATVAGASTTCSVSNTQGTCSGARKCGAAGLTACDAPTPAAETCNGADDDCDGQTDEGQSGAACEVSNSHGTCKGLTTCAGGAGGCDAATPAAESCNGADDDCDGQTDEGSPDLDKDGVADCVDPDIDGDGTPNAADCAPTDLAISPSATEVCNGKDDDCDGKTDEAGAKGCTDLWPDADADTWGAGGAGDGTCLCQPTGAITATKHGDCDDAAKAVFPGAKELCNDVDDDCDGSTDEGCDDDGDGWCDAAMQAVGTPKACSQGLADCDDTKASVSPGAKEVCGNSVDDDCDGATDTGADATGCVAWHLDADKDGAGGDKSVCACAATGLYTATTATDCDDSDPKVKPGGVEVCVNGKDDDCDGAQDEAGAKGCSDHWADGDKDGYGGGQPACLCAPTTAHPVTKGGDCADGDGQVSPGAKELCNGKDDDCDGQTDEQDAIGCVPHYTDGDGDGVGNSANKACLCKASAPYVVTLGGDCDDTDKTVSPAAKETCGSKDEDCDGVTDEADALGCTDWFVDGDKDSWGVTSSKQCLCAKSKTHTASQGGDCDDTSPKSSPVGSEACGGKDEDCDGKTDEPGASGCSPWFKDGDVDGWGAVDDVSCLCQATAPYLSKKPGDCDDAKSGVNPAASETCNGLDDNCNGSTDETGAKGCSVYFADGDKDGYGNPLTGSQCLCAAKAPYTALQAGDCNDADKGINKGATEACNSKDDDCDGITDELGATGCKPWYLDADQDGYGLSQQSQCRCKAAAPFTASQPGDCHDGNKAINPAGKETCNNLDDNCNGATDEGEGDTTFYFDQDGDGFGTAASAKLCKATGNYKASKTGDCNDVDKAVFPGNPEVCDGKDNNCDGQTDNGAQGAKTWYLDGDKDGWGLTGASKVACSAVAPYTATKGGDCADGDATVNPGKVEIQCNKKDDDCKGGDACTQCSGVCGGKCGSSSPQTTTSVTCITIAGITICQPVTVTCYCDSACVGLGDCCPGRATCCQ